MVREITKDLEILSQKSVDFIPGLDDHLIADMCADSDAWESEYNVLRSIRYW